MMRLAPHAPSLPKQPAQQSENPLSQACTHLGTPAVLQRNSCPLHHPVAFQRSQLCVHRAKRYETHLLSRIGLRREPAQTVIYQAVAAEQ